MFSIGVGGEKEKGKGEVMGVRGNSFGRPACAGPAGWLCVCWGDGGGGEMCVVWRGVVSVWVPSGRCEPRGAIERTHGPKGCTLDTYTTLHYTCFDLSLPSHAGPPRRAGVRRPRRRGTGGRARGAGGGRWQGPRPALWFVGGWVCGCGCGCVWVCGCVC